MTFVPPLRWALAGLFLPVAFSAATPETPATQVTPATPAKPVVSLAKLRDGHPRLLWTAEAQRANGELFANDPLFREFNAKVVEQAEALLTAPVATHTLVGYRMLKQSRDALARILMTSYAWRVTGDERYRERAVREMRAVCAFPDWNPQHFLDTSEMAFAVSVGYDWLYPALCEEDRTLIRDALVAKALKPGLAVYRAKSGWHTRDNNWNQVCNGGLIAAALAVADAEPTVAREVLESAVKSMPRAIRQYAPDGGYQEGPVYWQYGTTYDVIALALLRGALGDDFGLADEPAFHRTALFYGQARGPSGLFFNYSDCPPDAEPTPAYAWLGNEYGPASVRADARAELAAYMKNYRPEWHECGRFFALYGVWFPKPASGDIAGPGLDAHFHGNADIAMLRGSWEDPDAAYAGFKAGKIDVPHSHMDLGSFVFDSLGERWVSDLGPDEYDLPGYWDSAGGRWKIFRLGNAGHGTLIPDGARMSPKGSAVIMKFESAPDHAVAVADLTRAYAGDFTRWERGLRLYRSAKSLLIRDEIRTAKSGVALESALFTQASVVIDPADATHAVLTRNGKTLHARILSPAGFVFATAPATEPKSPAKSNKGFTRLVATGKLAGADGVIVVTLSPDEKKAGPESTGPALADWK